MTLQTAPFQKVFATPIKRSVNGPTFLRPLQCLYVALAGLTPQDMVRRRRGIIADDAPASHYCDFGLQVFGKKSFLPMIAVREEDFAPSWGLGLPRPCSKRGRQQKWYKDFWLLHSQRFLRLWLYRAVRTVPRYPLLRIWPCYRRSHLTDLFTKKLCRGRGQALVRNTPFSKECV